jgi:hypothetical protein
MKLGQCFSHQRYISERSVLIISSCSLKSSAPWISSSKYYINILFDADHVDTEVPYRVYTQERDAALI